MNRPELFNEDNVATYCPEDDKLRLYVGRVPREEYEALRAEGWTSTPKQDCDFVAVWTPRREDTALSYAGIVLDEDMSPTERAADRAERFGGYRDKRLGEATGHADRFDSRPLAHGFQSQQRAARSAARHDRIATHAVNAWDKAEYWESRTRGVISHALHVSSPSVRMGRIKTIEAEKRKAEKVAGDYAAKHAEISSIAENPAPAIARLAAQYYGSDLAKAEKALAEYIAGSVKIKHPRNPELPAAYVGEWMRESTPEENRVTAQEIAAQWLADAAEPHSSTTGNARFIRHCDLRLAYENQMIEAQGGRAAHIEMEKGGTLGGKVIAKVNKSPATGRVVSVAVIVESVDSWTYKIANEPGTPYVLATIDTERLAPGSYSEPTLDSLAKLEEFEAARKAALAAHKAKTPPCPTVNPTREDAERLQALINAHHVAEWIRHHGQPTEHYKPKTAEVCAITQATYSANSKGSYARAEIRGVCGNGIVEEKHLGTRSAQARAKARGPAVCKVRVTGFDPVQVIFLTDKPAKPLPAAVWTPYIQPVEESAPESVKTDA